MPAFMANAWNHSCTSSVSKAPTLSRPNLALNTRNGRPDTSMATRVSASSIGTCTLGIAGDALHVAERLLHRLAERDADILGGVVVVDVQVALGLDRDVDARVARQQIEHVVEEADAGRDVRDALAVEIDRDLDVGLLGGALDRAPCGRLARFRRGPAGAFRYDFAAAGHGNRLLR